MNQGEIVTSKPDNHGFRRVHQSSDGMAVFQHLRVGLPDHGRSAKTFAKNGEVTMQPEVLIAGAGPVGMTAACELARFGIPLRIVDKAAQRTDKSKALVLWSRSLELLDRGPGGAAPFVNAGFKALAVNFVARDGELMGHVSMESVKSPFPYGLMLPQSETERLLEERLKGLGVSVERQVEVLGFKPSGTGIHATLRRADGGE
jgi:2-polyprenyl-6-methoxyphenol hydroxylase-like FAD-dependent oxidoreductase